jgi:hypothetical protein
MCLTVTVTVTVTVIMTVAVTVAVTVTVAVAVIAILILIMAMIVIVVVRRRRGQGFAGRDGAQRRNDFGLTGGEYLDALPRHALDEAAASAAGDDRIESEPEQWMIVSVIIMQRHAFRQIDSLYLDGFLAWR